MHMLKDCRGMLRYSLLLMIILSGITRNAKAGASFMAGQRTGCSPLNVQFINTSTASVNYYWDLGNGNTSTLQNPVNVYTTPGSYTVTLIAYDISGNADTARFVNFITVS